MLFEKNNITIGSALFGVTLALIGRKRWQWSEPRGVVTAVGTTALGSIVSHQWMGPVVASPSRSPTARAFADWTSLKERLRDVEDSKEPALSSADIGEGTADQAVTGYDPAKMVTVGQLAHLFGSWLDRPLFCQNFYLFGWDQNGFPIVNETGEAEDVELFLASWGRLIRALEAIDRRGYRPRVEEHSLGTLAPDICCLWARGGRQLPFVVESELRVRSPSSCLMLKKILQNDQASYRILRALVREVKGGGEPYPWGPRECGD